MEVDLIIGLGNPGREYEQTKHNVGWLLLDQFKPLEDVYWKSKFKGEYTSTELKSHKLYFLKPQTYMNLSGESARPLIDFFKLDPKRVLVLHDELDHPFGKVSFKKGGGLAGHNGLKSLAAHLETQDFYRMRIGIGRPQHGDVADYVLSKFSGDEAIALEDYLHKAQSALSFFLKQGMSKAANKYNKKNLVELG